MNGVRAKKRFGQHFLADDRIARRITEALTHHGGYRLVIEVGPGTGALTRHLIDRSDIDLRCVEVDAEAAAHMRSAFPTLGARLVETDFLRVDLGRLVDQATGAPNAPFAVIGNFPYNISTEIVFRVLEHKHRCMEVVGMFQKEVADRLRAAPGSRTYGITSVLAQAWYDIDPVMTVEPGSFAPPPKVRSAVVRMRRNGVERLPCDEALFIRVVKAAFNQRRKTLGNALKALPELAGRVPAEFAGLRAEQLSVADLTALAVAAGR
jgi:16S rRNA (adenine1518-N6/adenine1519-N6)-dimethyltransferase